MNIPNDKPKRIKYIASTVAPIPLKAKLEKAFIFFSLIIPFLSGNKFIFLTAVTNL